MKKVVVVLLVLCFMAGSAFAGKWQFKEASVVGWAVATDEGETGINLPGFKNPYGVTVAPDGNIWCGAYYQRYWLAEDGVTKVWPDDITIQVTADSSFVIGTYPVFIHKTDGTNDFLQYLTYPDGKIDTTFGGCRGFGTDHEGNIIYARNSASMCPSSIYKLNSLTYQVMARYDVDFSPARPAVDENGYTYFTSLFGGQLIILDPDDWSAPYNSIAEISPPSVCRGIEVSPDGKNIYVAAYAGGLHHYYSEDGVDGTYALVDTLFGEHNGTAIEANIVQWDPSGLLWVGTREEAALKIFWALDPANNYAIVDSTSFTWWGNTAMDDTTTGGYAQPQYIRAPRDAAFSPDGKMLYIADMYSYVIKAYEYIDTSVDLAGESLVPLTFDLQQNYPNPFNPTTAINFNLLTKGFVELKVFDIKGREIKTLINKKMEQGNHQVIFDATGLATGVYYYTLNHNGMTQTKQMVLVK